MRFLIVLAPIAAVLALFGMRECISAGEDAKNESEWDAGRQKMIKQLQVYGITHTNILAAMGKIRRHMFIPREYRNVHTAYADRPCPIGRDQTISQPYIVAHMTECLNMKPGEKVLEIGTGSGYQAAVLAECGADVYTIEIIPELAKHAETVLKAEGYTNRVHVLTGDGYKGWKENMPFDDIIVTCAPEEIPQALVDQLKEGGRMVLPLGEIGDQRLVILTKKSGKVEIKRDLPVRFVPMVHGSDR